MVQAPQTSSRQPESHTTGSTSSPLVVVGWAAMYCSTLMMFCAGFTGTSNSCQ